MGSIRTAEEGVAVAAALEPVDGMVLQVLVVLDGGVTLTRLVKTLRGRWHRMPNGKAWKIDRVRPVLDRLCASGLISRGHSVDPALRLLLGCEMVLDGSLDDIARSMERELEGWSLHASSLFVAVLTGDQPAMVEAWEACRGASSRRRPLQEMLFHGDEVQVVDSLTVPVRDLVMREVFGPVRSLRDAKLCARLLPALERHCAGAGASVRVRVRLAEQLLWAWRHDDAAQVLQGLKGPLAVALTGWISLVSEDIAGSSRRLRGQPGDAILVVLEMVALLSSGGEGVAQAREALGRFPSALLLNERHTSGWSGRLFGELKCLVDTVAGGRVEPHGSSRYCSNADLAALVEALWMLAAGHLFSKRLIEGLRLLQDQADELGHAWLTAQVGAVLASASGDAAAAEELAKVHRAHGQVSLTDLIRPRARWERQLDDLSALGAPVKPRPKAAPPKAAKERLAWSIELTARGWLLIAPRLQKRGKKGWTGGRAIALERLYGDVSELKYLSAHDRRVLKHLQCEVSYGGYRGRYEERMYSFDDDAILELVGHPLLLRDADASRPVSLSLGKAEIVVDAAEDDVIVRLDPPGSARLIFRESEPDRIQVIPLSKRQQEVGQVLGEGMRVPRQEIDRVRTVLSAIAGNIGIRSAVAGWGADAVQVDCTIYVRAALRGDGLSVRCVVRPLGIEGPELVPGVGAQTVLGQRGGKPVQAERDLDVEQRGVEAFLRWCPTLSAFGVGPARWSIDDAVQRLSAAAELAQWQGTVEWDGAPVSVVAADLSQLDVTATYGDRLRLRGALSAGGDVRVELPGLLDLLSASPGRVLLVGDGTLLAVSEALATLLRQVAPWATSRRGQLELSPFGIEAAAALVDAADGQMDAAFRASAARLREADRLELPTPRTLQAELRDYQQVGFCWMARLAHWSTGACLADDMGLGKTVQTLALLLHRASDGPALVVAPKSVCSGWIEEARRFAPTLDVVPLWRGDRAQVLSDAGAGTLVICSYGLLLSERQALSDMRWATVVLDEAQHIKNPRARRTQAAMSLDAGFRIALTGTPIENRLTDLWAIFAFTNPGLLGSLTAFKKRWVGAVEHDPVARRALRRLVRAFLLRRTKSEVLDELPARTDVVVRVEPTPEEAVVYEALRRAAVDDLQSNVGDKGWRMRIFAHLTRLRLAVCHPSLVDDLPEQFAVVDRGGSKLAALEEIVQTLGEGGHRALVFSQFVRHLRRVRRRLDALGVSYQYLDGSTPMAARAKAVAAFQAGEGDLFLISLRAGGTGLNLTAADYVVHLDPWWNPAVEDQASDRAHRIGQTRPVTVYRLVMAGTIEDRIVELHARKRALADAVLGGSGVAGSLTSDEIMALLTEPMG